MKDGERKITFDNNLMKKTNQKNLKKIPTDI